ncbi:predicted protein [Plenodomus lingam JN3]|uniref:Predicted protein n=1 Tax=Leptosphaeria maculans (strain JN3 / isolate v23.1.3 / race Av1-4-5-6-7-8) TaxID=985895 RepID=E5A8S8_LEPMJ|nr:predicted protein [Plenodomus lingam JN3]CBY00023.1 predicted protein [Plenodomus lingam JN3]
MKSWSELATVLSPTIPIVESSANPAAIISSRLATYLKRTWTALSRCPLDKKLVGTHPKRVYYFLSTCPHQPIPADGGNVPSAARIISPSLSSAASEEEEDLDARSRARMSPSPELDLSDYDSNASDPFSNQSHPPTTANIANNRRAQSPPLEKDEREFTQTASFLQQRRRSQEAERSARASAEPSTKQDVVMDEVSHSIEETEESAARKNSEAAAALFGHLDHLSSFQASLVPSSPAVKPTLHMEMPPPSLKRKQPKFELDDEEDWAMKSPESIHVDELDDLFDDCN